MQLMSHRSIFKSLIGFSKQVMESLPDSRLPSNAQKYDVCEAGMGALSVFMFQDASFLLHQQRLSDATGRHNFKSMFGIDSIPTPNQIRNILDPVSPDEFHGLYDQALHLLQSHKGLSQFEYLKNSTLIALDGSEYHSSQKIHCPCCNHRTHSGVKTYFHSAILASIVSPDSKEVIPLIPEFMTPQDGHQKQDCENTAAKRWFSKHATRYNALNPTYLGDDLYSRQPICEAVMEQGGHFIFVCKPSSHKILHEYVSGVSLEKTTVSTKKRHKKYRYQYQFMNQVPLKDGDDGLLVNWLSVSEIDPKTGKVVYKNSFITNHTLSADNVHQMAQAGRSRWKIENENNNTLKTKGYRFEHNYGHGKKNLSSVFATLTIVAFLYHTVMNIVDLLYIKAKEAQGSRVNFYNNIKSLIRFICFKSWEQLMEFILKPPDERPLIEI